MLMEYGEVQKDPNVQLDAAWKLADWPAVKRMFNMPSVVALAECQLPDCKLMLYQIYVAINEGRTSEVESLCKQGAQLVLQKWQSLPASAHCAHISAMQMFQNLERPCPDRPSGWTAESY